MNLSFYCTCGAEHEHTNIEPETVMALLKIFRELHTGPGHKECTRAEARRAQLLSEIEMERKARKSDD